MEFPTLSTGAVAQYPNTVQIGAEVEILTFLDGSEQRYLRKRYTKKVWRIKLSSLSDSEFAAIRAFFDAVRGSKETFTFRDPWGDTQYENCRLGNDTLTAEWTGADGIDTELIVQKEGEV